MINRCRNCQNPFEVTDKDMEFYKKIEVTPPSFCPSCRLQRRLSFRNESKLHKRSCDLCKRPVISFYSEQSRFPVYCMECWWSDQWDPSSYGRDFDFSRPFFDQMKELMQVVPKASALHLNNENSEYNALLAFSKNTYMSAGSYYVEDCLYARKSQYSKDCLISNFLDHCELVAWSTNSKNCYRAHHLLNCRSCNNSAYLADCTSCENCFMCSGLSNKKFCFKNQQLSEEDYQKKVEEYQDKNPKDIWKEFCTFSASIPKRYQNQLSCENSSGDYIYNSRNATEVYDCFEVQDSKYLLECVNVKDSMDLSMHDKDIELCYELCSGGDSNFNLKFSYCSCASPNSSYLFSCFYLEDSLGCDGFHARQKNYILNKKYGESEYQELKKRIIEHMKRTGEWGEFFPITLSSFPYNESVAFNSFPLTREAALQNGYSWAEEESRSVATALGVLQCEVCSKPYRIIPQEAALGQKIGVPPSTLCADCRFAELFSWKNPHQLWSGQCDRCSMSIQTTYSPSRPEKVYCEKCYLESVY